jgi:HSP20 family protein
MNNTGQNSGWLRKRPATREFHPLSINFWEDFFEPFGVLTSEEKKTFSPKIDVKETDTEIKVKAELPGLTQENVHVDVTDDALVIKGEKSEEHEEKDEKNVRRYVERSYGSFQRVIPISAEVDRENVDASFKHGILSIVLPKSKKAKENTKKINIRTE